MLLADLGTDPQSTCLFDEDQELTIYDIYCKSDAEAKSAKILTG